MKQKLSFQVTEIQNGWIIAVPADQDELRAAQVSGRQPQGTVIYCEEYEQVCVELKKLWPSDLKLS